MAISELTYNDLYPDSETLRKPNLSFGSYLPKFILTNKKIEAWGLETVKGESMDNKFLIQKTGIQERYVADEKETPLSMGTSAAKDALRSLEKEVDIVMVTTSFPQGINLSDKISQALGLSPALIKDVHAACSGFSRTLSFLKEKGEEYDLNGKRILIVATEKYSPYLHDLKTEGAETNPSLAQTIFSDGAYAITFEYGRDLQILSALNHRFPKEIEPYIRMPVDKNLMIAPFIEEFVPYSEQFEQYGRGVLGAVARNIWSLIDETVKKADLAPLDIKKIFPHQGSGPMINAIIRGKPDVYPHGIVYEDYYEGNFSSGSIPKAMQKALINGEIRKGDNLVLAGFGAGMFASIAIVRV